MEPEPFCGAAFTPSGRTCFFPNFFLRFAKNSFDLLIKGSNQDVLSAM